MTTQEQQVDKEVIAKITAMIEEQELTKEELIGYLRQIMEIRRLENNIADLLGRAVLKGASHLYAGQEAVAVGAIAALRDTDLITSTHRGHGHAHAHGDKVAQTPEAKQQHYNKMMAEVLGKSGGYCKGKGGSMHIADVEHGNLGATGIVGGNIPVAVGAALAQKIQGTDRVVLCFFGDGASNTGNFHESLNMASLWDLPVIFVVENNMYAMSVPWKNASKLPDVASRACAYGIPGEVVDGMDVLAVRGAVAKAVSRAREGKGPTLIEAKTYRWYGHSHSDPRAYRTREEEAEWKKRDPITVLKNNLEAIRFLTEEEFEQMEEAVEKKIEIAMEYSNNSKEPDPKELETDVFAQSKFTQADIDAEKKLRENIRSGKYTREISYAQALVEAMREEMIRDKNVFVMGEDVGLYGGAYGATRGLWEEFGDWRVIDTPISEATIGGAAVGAAMAGMRPVAEIMYVDFTPLAMDQIANQEGITVTEEDVATGYERIAAQAGDVFGEVTYAGGLVTLTADGLGRQVGGIGLDGEAVERDVGRDLPGTLRRRVGDSRGDRDHKADLQVTAGEFQVPGVAVHHAERPFGGRWRPLHKGERYLAAATRLYGLILEMPAKADERARRSPPALLELAALAEGRGDTAAAKGLYARVLADEAAEGAVRARARNALEDIAYFE